MINKHCPKTPCKSCNRERIGTDFEFCKKFDVCSASLDWVRILMAQPLDGDSFLQTHTGRGERIR